MGCRHVRRFALRSARFPACREDAEAVAALIEEQIPQLKGKIEINNIGTLIGSHTGPGTVALFFMGDKRVD